MEGACRVDNGVVFHEGIESKGNTSHLSRLLCHGGGVGVVQRIIMKLGVQFNVILGRGAAVDGGYMGREISRALSSLMLRQSVIDLICTATPAGWLGRTVEGPAS